VARRVKSCHINVMFRQRLPLMIEPVYES
jgi:hypothetical protein